MTAYERQALRDKHFRDFCDCPDEHPPFKCVGCARHGSVVVWPCDVVKVLDAWEDESQHILSVVDEEMRSSLKVAVINGILREVEV